MIGHITNYEIPFEIREKVINSQYEWMLKRKIKAFYLLLESGSLASGAKTMLQVQRSNEQQTNQLHVNTHFAFRFRAWAENYRPAL